MGSKRQQVVRWFVASTDAITTLWAFRSTTSVFKFSTCSISSSFDPGPVLLITHMKILWRTTEQERSLFFLLLLLRNPVQVVVDLCPQARLLFEFLQAAAAHALRLSEGALHEVRRLIVEPISTYEELLLPLPSALLAPVCCEHKTVQQTKAGRSILCSACGAFFQEDVCAAWE